MDRLISGVLVAGKKAIAGLSVLLLLLFQLLFFQKAVAEPLSSDYAAAPSLLSNTSEPLVMLVMSVDHELFKKAYSDYTDLDEDGQLDTRYVDSFDYLGYFDSDWCYQYTGNYFNPSAGATGSNGHSCTTNAAPWSGNFLNWATMARVDIVRKVLFGGKRSTDSASQTLLERAYLPRDVHSFVKVYSGNDTADFTPFSGAVSLCNVAASENGTPVVRVAQGAWPRWASTEVRQCQWSSSDVNSASSGDKLVEHNVLVEACVQGKDGASSASCQSYPSGTIKPVGLLQKYGESGGIRFGLISGSYDNNIAGGVLRRNITRFAGNALASVDEINLETGQFNGAVNGIIQHINTVRIAKYSFSTSKYLDCSTYGIGVTTFRGNAARALTSSRHCSNWGNPLAEMYLEALRYFSGETSPSNQYHTDDDDYFVPGISASGWVSPQTFANPCANCSIILLSTGLNSFDADQFGAANDVPGINGSSGVHSLTDLVGVMEAATNPAVRFPGTYLSDKNGGDRQCEETEISKLSDIRGICPELPQLEGGYQIAGLAWHGRKTDLRTDLDGIQSVKSYVIQLGDNIPSFTLEVGGRPVTFQPVCQAHSNRSECSLTDVIIQSQTSDGKSGSFLFTWEDSLWGNDYDYDASSSIDYCIGSACSPAIGDTQVQISVRQEAKNAGAETWYSFTVTGTDRDGIYSPFAEDTGSSVSQGQGLAVSHIFNAAAGGAATLLPKPIWFAAKYGGFTDLDGDGTPGFDGNGDGHPDPGDSREWDSRINHSGLTGSDGLPDNFFFSRNPSMLAAQLEQVLSDISRRVSSATNAALFANNSTGTGALYQALFQPSLEVNGKTVTWGGLLHSLFVDSKGHLREDGNGNDRLDDYSTDKIVELFFDPNAGQTQVQRFSSEDNGLTKNTEGALKPLSSLASIWDARDQLSQLSNLTSQRTYGAQASGGRHILTWLDQDNDQQVDDNEMLPFMTDTFAGSNGNEGYLGLPQSEALNLVNYIRGEEQTGARSRTIDYNGDGILDVWRLGDVIHSTPRLVASPDSRFDAYYNDSSYKAFRNQYINRRHVLYVGANDGLLHAFNGGFWDESTHSYLRTGGNGEVQHPLGSELWAYAPMNLLPHLRWLREVDYPHVYYMDSEPLVFDANIFEADAEHPGGWGTLLVMGMRLGGGTIDVTVNGNSRTMRSAYVLMDITNPEEPPALLAEITHSGLGLTTSKPALIKRRVPGVSAGGETDWLNPDKNDWYLVFGSGPAGTGQVALREALDQGKSDQNMRLFVYDLKQRQFVTGFDPMVTSYASSYAGDMTVVDWDNDFQDDAVYFGAVETGGASLDGKLMRLRLYSEVGDSTLGVFLDTGQPVQAPPLTRVDQDSYWVYSGTGRLMTVNDNRDTAANDFYGIQEPRNSSGQFTWATVSQGDLVNVGDVEVLTNGNVRKKTGNTYTPFYVDSNPVGSFAALQETVKVRSGWKRRLTYDASQPSGRNVNQATALYQFILFTEYQPSANSCSVDGNSFLHAVHYLTGTASDVPVLGSVPVDDLETERGLDRVRLGVGYASSPVIHQGEGNRHSAVTQGAGGSITATELHYGVRSDGRQSWWQIFNIPF